MQSIQPVYTRGVVDECGRDLYLEYYVTDSACLSDGAQGISTFGIRVVLSVEGKESDTSAVTDITPSKSAVLKLAALLSKNSVTPATLKDVIEDAISLQI